MVMDEGTAEHLRAADTLTLRAFVAGCAERVGAVFCVIRALDPDRSADVSVVVESLDELWDPATSRADLESRRRRVEGFWELQPSESGLSKTADVYAFYGALVLRYALDCAATGDAAAGLKCSHVCLTAVGQLDSNVQGGHFVRDEQVRQAQVLSQLGAGAPWARLREADRFAGRRIESAISARLGG